MAAGHHLGNDNNSETVYPVNLLFDSKLKLKSRVKFLMETHLNTTGCHTMLLATLHKRMHPALTLTASEVLYLIYLPRRDGRLS